MQQTNQYKLNLIEKTDTFSPDPLNENTEKVEAQLAAETLARTAADTAETQARTAADAAEAKARADAVAAETQNRTAAITAEAKTRADAITAETNARKSADTTEANTRAAAITAEAKARTDAVAAEAKARADADTAETNARKSADTTEANTRAAAITALDNRVKKLEARRIVTGSYNGNAALNTTGVYQDINLGFQPNLVIVFNPKYMMSNMAAPGAAFQNALSVTSTGFKVSNTNGNAALNISGCKFLYLAIL